MLEKINFMSDDGTETEFFVLEQTKSMGRLTFW